MVVECLEKAVRRLGSVWGPIETKHGVFQLFDIYFSLFRQTERGRARDV